MRKLIVWPGIDDSMSPDHLFIEDFEHESRPV